MPPERSIFHCNLKWEGNNEDYENFTRLHTVTFPGGLKLESGAGPKPQNPTHTNPEEIFAASVASCMMQTVLAVFSKSRIVITSYEDTPEALLEFVERRFRVTKVTLRPKITIQGTHDAEKLKTLIEKSHANCFITLSVKSEVVVEPQFISV